MRISLSRFLSLFRVKPAQPEKCLQFDCRMLRICAHDDGTAEPVAGFLFLPLLLLSFFSVQPPPPPQNPNRTDATVSDVGEADDEKPMNVSQWKSRPGKADATGYIQSCSYRCHVSWTSSPILPYPPPVRIRRKKKKSYKGLIHSALFCIARVMIVGRVCYEDCLRASYCQLLSFRIIIIIIMMNGDDFLTCCYICYWEASSAAKLWEEFCWTRRRRRCMSS